eukprot:TRINITY_DN10099_c1_g1_i1.p2 TRINITY_DN10099_c1_g1~~TRINITY_DN10099_c1_g1_i1.p2  ORF type:complete len:158 (+),score=74.78 TRINITY_DN10099_c1_g1_i1:145-618(+)
MGKKSSSSSSSGSSSSSSSSSEEEKKKKKKKKKAKTDKKEKKKKSKKDKDKKKKKEKKEKKKDKKKKDDKEVPAKVLQRVSCGFPTAGPSEAGPSVADAREKLLREAGQVPVAVPGATPEVKGTDRFEAAKDRLEKLRGAQQRKQAKVEYSVRKPNW